MSSGTDIKEIVALQDPLINDFPNGILKYHSTACYRALTSVIKSEGGGPRERFGGSSVVYF